MVSLVSMDGVGLLTSKSMSSGICWRKEVRSGSEAVPPSVAPISRRLRGGGQISRPISCLGVVLSLDSPRTRSAREFASVVLVICVDRLIERESM